MAVDWLALSAGFSAQARFCEGYSPLYQTIFAHAAEITRRHAASETLGFDERALIDLLEQGWAERTLQNMVEGTLLLTGAIHAAVLADSPEAAPISRFFETAGGSYEPEADRDVLRQMLGGLYLNPGEVVREFLRSGRVQTNEISRGAMWLLPVIALSAWRPGLPISVVDLGCSAGLNLAADVQSWRWVSADGERRLGSGEPLISQQLDLGHAESSLWEALPPGDLPHPNIVQRLGLDLHPLDPGHPADLFMLRACIWGDQARRLARFDQVAANYLALEHRPVLETADIIDAARTLHERLSPETTCLLVYNTTVTVYLDDRDYARLRMNIQESFRNLPSGVCSLWIEHEMQRKGEPSIPPRLGALKVHLLDLSGFLEARYLAYAEPHPQTIMLLKGWDDLRSLVSAPS